MKVVFLIFFTLMTIIPIESFSDNTNSTTETKDNKDEMTKLNLTDIKFIDAIYGTGFLAKFTEECLVVTNEKEKETGYIIENNTKRIEAEKECLIEKINMLDVSQFDMYLVRTISSIEFQVIKAGRISAENAEILMEIQKENKVSKHQSDIFAIVGIGIAVFSLGAALIFSIKGIRDSLLLKIQTTKLEIISNDMKNEIKKMHETSHQLKNQIEKIALDVKLAVQKQIENIGKMNEKITEK